MVRLPVAALLLVTSAFAGERIFIVTDMEGVGGVNNADEQLLPGQRRYDESRYLLTGELNAAIAGAFAAGATEVTVWDGHDGSRSLSIDDIDARARLIQGRPTPANYYLSDRAYDAIFFIGQHAMAGAKGGILSHSQSFAVEKITINGRAVGEIGQVAAIAGYFHIPVAMLSGDQAACDEIHELQPQAETVAVKRLAGKGSSLSLSHDAAKAAIRAAAERAVARIGELKPWRVDGPVEMVFRFYPKDKETAGRTAVYKGKNVLEAYEAWLGKPE
jgi:D-amino peptidase